METPNLDRIVETEVPILSLEYDSYLNQLRKDVLPLIRELQIAGHLRWFSFLLHPAKQVIGHDPVDESPVFHLRLEPEIGLDIQAFIKLLPSHFLNPHQVALSQIDGPESSILRDSEWAYAWKIVGESAEWILCLLEAHEDEIPPKQIVQFLHYITNPLMLGGRCLCIPDGFLPF